MAKPNEESKAGMATNSLAYFPQPPKFSDKRQERDYLKFRLAQAFRIFASLGYDEGVAGHITARDPIKPDCFWVNPFGLHFSLIQPSDLLLVDHDGNVLDESGPMRLLNSAAFAIHSAIHAARPDVLCAAHSHSIHGRAFASFGRELQMFSQDDCAFYGDHAVYKQFNGVVLAEDEGKHIAETLGQKKAIILQVRDDGRLCVLDLQRSPLEPRASLATSSVEATVYYFAKLEKCCQAQLLVMAATQGGAKPITIGRQEAEDTFQTVGLKGWFGGRLHFQQLEAHEGVKYCISNGV